MFLSEILKLKLWTTTKELPLTLFAIFWFLFCTFLVSLTNVYLDRVNPYVHVPIQNRFRMKDPLLEFLYHYYLLLGFPWNFPDPLAHFAPVIMFIRVLIAGQQGCLILRRLGYLVGTGYLIRIPFILMTMLPNPLLSCTIDPNPNLFIYALEVMFQLKATCGDVIFSGHTIMFMSSSLVWVENPVTWFPSSVSFMVNLITILFSFFGVLIMVASTYHYTVDCTLSVLVMLFLWKFYHFMVRHPNLDELSVCKWIRWVDGTRYLDRPRDLPPQELSQSL